MSACRVQVSGQTLQFLPERCALWEERGALLLADLHLGKSAAFRAAGLAVPEGSTTDDLARLERVVRSTGAREIIVVGDLFHAPSGRSQEVLRLFGAWRSEHASLRVRLVVGNHDRRALPPAECAVEVVGKRCDLAPFHFVHDPEESHKTAFSIAGHIHPVVSLPGPLALRAACFWMLKNTLVLPSFGGFTGGAVIDRNGSDRVFAIADDCVREIPASVWNKRATTGGAKRATA